jgi:HSP20 family protein
MAEKTSVPVKANGQTLRRWSPFELLEELQDEMTRLWGEPWPFFTRPFRRVALAPTTWTPRVDMYEKDGNLVITTDLPGTTPEDVEVTIEEGDLIIRGERKAEKEVKEENYYRMERSYGSFYRCIPLPEGIKPDQIKATFANGVLEITIPKPLEEKPKAQKIAITTK